jgi:hypothetical protein
VVVSSGFCIYKIGGQQRRKNSLLSVQEEDGDDDDVPPPPPSQQQQQQQQQGSDKSGKNKGFSARKMSIADLGLATSKYATQFDEVNNFIHISDGNLTPKKLEHFILINKLLKNGLAFRFIDHQVMKLSSG